MVVAYTEEAGSPRENYNPSFTASRVLRCAWGDRHVLVDEIVGGDAGQGLLYEPATATQGRALTASILPAPGQQIPFSSTVAGYESALVTINYGFGKGESVNLVSESLEPTAEFMTEDNRLYQWDTEVLDADLMLKEDEAPGRLLIGLDYVLTRYQVPLIPASILTLPGSVNDATVTSSTLQISAGPAVFMSFAAQTLLFQSPVMDRTIQTDNSPTWTLRYRLSFRAPGWNVYWRSKNQAYETIFRTGQGAYVSYPLASFSGILP